MPAVLAALLVSLVLLGCHRDENRRVASTAAGPAGFRLLPPGDRDTILEAREPLVLRFSSPVTAALLGDDAVRVGTRDSTTADPDVDVVLRGTESKYELAVHPRESWIRNLEYEARISPLLFDSTRTILDRTSSVRFRVRDGRGPSLARTTVTRRGIEMTFDRAVRLSPTRVLVLRENGVVVPAQCATDARVLRVEATRGLASNARIELRVTGLTDRDGDPAPELNFAGRALPDVEAPTVVSTTPRGAAIAQAGSFVLRFDESIDRRALSVRAEQPLQVHLDATQRELRIRSKRRWRAKACEITIDGIEDRSGNRAPAIRVHRRVEASPRPRVVRTIPVDQGQLLAERPIVIRTSRSIEPESTTDLVLQIEDDTRPREHEIRARVADDGCTIVVFPDPPLAAGARGKLYVELRSLDGYALPRREIAFDVVTAKPTAVRWMHDAPVAAGFGPIWRFSKPIVDLPHDAVRVSPDVALRTRLESGGQELRVDADFVPSTRYRLEIRAGIDGPRFADGSTLRAPVAADFEIDGAARARPALELFANATDTVVGVGEHILVPRETCRITFGERGTPLDTKSIRLSLDGPRGLDHTALLPSLRWFGDRGAIELDLSGHASVISGEHSLHVAARDVSGQPVSARLGFEIVDRRHAHRAFDRVQLVHIRFDRDDDGAPGRDFERDLELFGLLPREDHEGLRRDLILDFESLVLDYAHALFDRDANGDPQSTGAARIRLTTELPRELRASTLRVGGLDPLGPARRELGDASTGYLGRAIYDAKNLDVQDGDDARFGVFPRELLLAQIDYARLAPTPFTRSFAPFCAHLGGTPFGTSAGDRRILRGDIALTPALRARATAWRDARHKLARALARLIAHEIGHLVGLVAPGPLPRGLRGDDGLHDGTARASAVMASHTTWLQLCDASSSFQAVEASYLRDAILLR